MLKPHRVFQPFSKISFLVFTMGLLSWHVLSSSLDWSDIRSHTLTTSNHLYSALISGLENMKSSHFHCMLSQIRSTDFVKSRILRILCQLSYYLIVCLFLISHQSRCLFSFLKCSGDFWQGYVCCSSFYLFLYGFPFHGYRSCTRPIKMQ